MLLFSNLGIIVLALFNALIGLPEAFSFLFLSTIIYSPSGVALEPRMFVAYVASASLLNVKAVGADTGNNLGLNLSACFALAISLCLAGHAWDHDAWSPILHAAQRLLIACDFSAHYSVICCPPQWPHRCWLIQSRLIYPYY